MSVTLASSDESDYLGPSTLRRSLSQPSFSTHQYPYQKHFARSPANVYSDSSLSSVAESIATADHASARLSCSSIASSDISLPSDCDDETIPIAVALQDQYFLHDDYGDHHFLGPFEDLDPPSIFKEGPTYTVSPADLPPAITSRSDSPSFLDRAEDDSAVKPQPSRHVDYLSHEWKEEDIWSSWKYVTSRRSEISNSARLENASWRSWIKAKNNLKTVSPETLNWLKDCDVTWLYGPLQEAHTTIFSADQDTSSSALSYTNSFINKKPILKKRSVSEVMLQRSISSSSLLKQATAKVQAQESHGRRISHPALASASADYATFCFAPRPQSYESSSLTTSSASSGAISPSCERKRIHFNEQVEQCIAVEVKGENDDEIDRFGYDSDSSDGAIMMKRTTSKRPPPRRRKSTRKRRRPTDGKIIAKLPSTKLKSLEDSFEHPDTAMKHSTCIFRSPVLSPSSSQETLRPSKPSGRFLIDGDDEAGEDNRGDGPDHSADWDDMPNFSGPILPVGEPGPDRPVSSGNLSGEPAGMRRTPSGMFMPYEDGELVTSEGLFGRVIDTVNTARDIAHVIWNVGWRK